MVFYYFYLYLTIPYFPQQIEGGIYLVAKVGIPELHYLEGYFIFGTMRFFGLGIDFSADSPLSLTRAPACARPHIAGTPEDYETAVAGTVPNKSIINRSRSYCPPPLQDFPYYKR